MPDVNDDMDEFFKKAAENYPLNTNSSDWNAVLNALKATNAPLNNNGSTNKYRRLLWLLLLLPFVIVLTNRYGFNRVDQNVHTNSVVKKSSPGLSQLKNATVNEPHTSNVSTQNKLTGLPKFKANKSHVKIATYAGEKETSMQDHFFDNPSHNTVKVNDASILSYKSPNAIRGNAYTTEPGVNQSVAGKYDDVVNKNEKIKDIITKNTKKEMPENKLLPAADTSKYNKGLSARKAKDRQKRVYAGIIAGPDLSTVKLQKINTPGFTLGVLAGYKLNKKWSVESGLYVDKKFYYSEGKYFSTKKVPIPSTVTITNTNGECKMIEVPLNIKYNLKTNQRVNWFAVAGISSYIMKKEDYGYQLTAYGQMPWEKKYSYKNSSKNLASIINISAGYSHTIGKSGVLRVEPYIKVPIKGIGIGSLPIMSSGVYLGFTKNLF